jgi:hypothetical protein
MTVELPTSTGAADSRSSAKPTSSAHPAGSMRPTGAAGPGARPTRGAADRRARRLVACGAVAGPVFVGIGLTHAFLRPGFDMAVHPMSMLALGDTGWVQTACFLISGLAVLLWSAGARQVFPSRVLPWALRTLGIGLLGAGVFPADPAFGFPAGAPAGAPEVMSAAGALHAVAFGVAMLGWITAAVVLARGFARRGERAWAVASWVAVAGLVAPLPVMGVTPVLYVGSVLTWGCFTAVAVHLARR